MSTTHSDHEENQADEDQIDVNELAKQVEDKCWEAFLHFDTEGTGEIVHAELPLVL